MVVDKYAGRCLDVGSTPTGSIFFIHGRLLKRLKRPCWKRGRRVKACVGSNPMSSVEKQKLHFGAVFLSQVFKNQIIQTLYDFIKQKDIDF